MYTEKEARKLILSSIVLLKEKELLANTWGNISARISKDEFIITPSNICFEKMSEDDLVKVNIKDLSSKGNNIPSSQRKVHQAIYKLKEECNFIVHTHQNYATVLSLDEYNEIAPVCKYGIPYTSRLARNVLSCIKLNIDASAVLLKRHGIICFNKSFEDCYESLKDIERLAIAYYRENQTIKEPQLLKKPYLDDFAQIYGNKHQNVTKEDNDILRMISFKNTLAANFNKDIKPLSKLNVWYQHLMYVKKYKKQNNK